MYVRGTKVAVQIIIMERYKKFQLVSEIMFINGKRFLLSMSRHLKFIAIEHIQNWKDEHLMESVIQIKMVYAYRGFSIDIMLMEGEFASIENLFLS